MVVIKKNKPKTIRKLSRITMTGTGGGGIGAYMWIVLDDNGYPTKHKARQSEIDNWYREMSAKVSQLPSDVTIGS